MISCMRGGGTVRLLDFCIWLKPRKAASWSNPLFLPCRRPGVPELCAHLSGSEIVGRLSSPPEGGLGSNGLPRPLRDTEASSQAATSCMRWSIVCGASLGGSPELVIVLQRRFGARPGPRSSIDQRIIHG
eukprot:scaffold287_cov337-Pavlova_lutheri.AAC.163